MLKRLERLNKLLGDVVISQGGVVPHINPEVCAPLSVQERLLIHYHAAPAQQNSEGQEGESGSIGVPLLIALYCMICIISLL
jgi:C-terminus of histone H2A